MTKEKSGRNIWLDLFKFFLCYLIICIHLAGESYPHYPVYRLAVPMFFIISGYFNYHKNNEILSKKTVGFIKRTLRYMLIGFLIYIVFDFFMCYVRDMGVGYYFTTLFYEDFILEFLILNRPISYSGAQLWFLIALFVVSLIHYLLVKFQKTHWYKILIPVCFLIYFFFTGYMHLLQYTDMPVRYTRNALFFGLPNFALGFTLAKYDFHKKSWYKYLYLLLGIAFFFLQILENQIFENTLADPEMYISGVLSAVYLLLFFLGLKKTNCGGYYRWCGKSASFYIYIFHMAVAVVLELFFTFNNLLFKCLIVLLLSFAIYEICFLIGKGVVYWKNKKCLNEVSV